MGIFRRDPVEKFLNSRSKKIEYLVLNAEAFGTCFMASTPTGANLIYNNYSNQNGSYYLLPAGELHIRAKQSFDEFTGKVKAWGFGFGNYFPENICFRLDLDLFTFVVQEQKNGNALRWLDKYYPDCRNEFLSLF